VRLSVLRIRIRSLVVGGIALLLLVGDAEAGHEMPFYPSFYPQEITVSVLGPGAAAAALTKSSIQGYVGADPFAGGAAPAHVSYAESLGSYVVLGFDRASKAFAEPAARCAAAARTVRALGGVRSDLVVHPYPVTPLHGDYLQHFDRVEAARRPVTDTTGTEPRIRAASPRLAALLTAARLKVVEGEADATLEEVPLPALLSTAEMSVDGWLGPPWIRAGWFHAYLLALPGLNDSARRELDEAVHQRTAAATDDATARMNLERRVVDLATRGCRRVSVGYTVRREALSAEYSDGIENIAYDSQAGIASPIFVRTAKLKDFPWNGVLKLGAEHPPAAAWNPVAGFSDATGRLLWSAIGDPALLPAPNGGGWLANRVRTMPEATLTGSLDAPADALVPDPDGAGLRAAGRPVPAKAKVVYRVRASAFHDGVKMSVADVLYPYAFAFRWSAARGRVPDARHDPEVGRATAVLRENLAAVKVLRVDTEVKEFGEIQLLYDVPQVEVYLRSDLDAAFLPDLAPPWSAVPWQVLALMEEAVARGVGAFSAGEARRRHVPWLDLARDRKTHDELAALVAGFERRGFVPDALRGLVSAEPARQRWAALRRFAGKRGHFLVTNGPYRLDRWSADSVTLGVFRDLTYPLGVGGYDDQALPLRAFARKVERTGDRVVIDVDVETVVKGGRSYKIEREPFRPAPAGERTHDTLVARYVLVGPGDEVAAAGASRQRDGARLVIDVKRGLRPGAYRLVLALELNGNSVNPEVKVIPYRVAG
jgi:hypothetical protein